MTARPSAESNPWGLELWERIGVGLLSIPVALFSVWATFAVYFVIGLALSCPATAGGNVPTNVFAGLAIGAVAGVGLTLTYSLAWSAIRWRWLPRPSWLILPALCAVIGSAYFAIQMSYVPAAQPGCDRPIYD